MSTIHVMYAGALTPLRPGVETGIRKISKRVPWQVTANGLIGDHHGDRDRHGGVEKALHHYPREHYREWLSEEPTLSPLLERPPAFGENISTFGLTERNVFIGDIYKVGRVTLQVSQGRQPCWRLNAHFDRPHIAVRMQETGRTGWYYRVLQEGEIRRGDELRLLHRPQPSWPIVRALSLLYRRTRDFDELLELSKLPELAPSWRNLATRRCARRSVEDWRTRLEGPAHQASTATGTL